MFGPAYFGARHFGPRYFGPSLGLIVVQEEFGGSQFVGFIPLSEMLRRQLPVNAEVLPYTQESETEFIIDGKKYELVAKQTPSEIIHSYPNISGILDDAAEKMGTSRRKAKKELYNLIITELKATEEIKRSIFDDDDDIIMILVATDEI